MNSPSFFARTRWAAVALCAALSVGIGVAGDLQDIPDNANTFTRNAALRSLLSEANSTELADCFASAQRLSPRVRSEIVPQILRHWAAATPQAALRAALAAEPQIERQSLTRIVFEVWGEDDPIRAFEALTARQNAPEIQAMVSGFFQGYARRNPQEAFSCFLEKRRENLRLFSDYAPVNAILRAWAQRDPQSAMRALVVFREQGMYFSARQVMQGWFAEDPNGCLRAIKYVSDSFQSELIYDSIEENITFENADFILSFMRQNFKRNTAPVAGVVFEELAKDDLARAFARAQKIRDSEESKPALLAVFRVWADTDFDEAMAQTQGIEPPVLRNEIVQMLWQKRVNAKNLPAHMAALMGIKDPVLRHRLVRQISSQYFQAAGDIGLLMQAIPTTEGQRNFLLMMGRSVEGHSDGVFISDLNAGRKFREWVVALLPPSEYRIYLISGSMDAKGVGLSDLCWINEKLARGEAQRVLSDILFSAGEQTAKLLTVQNYNSLPDGEMRELFGAAMLSAMSKQSPEEALEWIKTMDPGGARDEAYRNIIRTLLEKGQMEKALATLREPIDGMEKGYDFYSEIAKKIARKNPEEAFAWALSLEEKEAREKAVYGAASAWSPQDPQGFFERIGKLPEGTEKNRALNAFLEVWGVAAPQDAGAWIKANAANNEALAQSAVDTIFNQWLNNDPLSATQWLSTLPSGSVRNRAISSLVYSSEAQKSPEAVMEWVVSIAPDHTEPRLREEMVRALVYRVAEKDYLAAEAIAQNPKLSEIEHKIAEKALEDSAKPR